MPGDEHVEAHFVLHNFKSTEPLNTSQLKNLKIAGTLKYKVYNIGLAIQRGKAIRVDCAVSYVNHVIYVHMCSMYCVLCGF